MGWVFDEVREHQAERHAGGWWTTGPQGRSAGL